VSGAPFPHAGEAAALSSSLLWAGAGVVFRRMKGRADAGAMNLAKNATAAGCFAVVLLVTTGLPWPTGLSTRASLLLAASGVLGLTVCDTLFLRSLLEVGPRRANLVMAGLSSLLVFGVTLLPPFRQTSRLGSPWPWIGLVLALAGLRLATREMPEGPHDAASTRRGLRDAAFAALFQASGVLLSRLAAEAGAPTREATSMRLLAGSAGLVVLGVVGGRAGAWTRSLASPGVLPRLAAAAFFGTFLGIWLNQAGITWADSTGVATVLNSLAPVWLIPLSSAFLGERHGLAAWTSTLLALAGVAMLTL
jgi:drug/metabolite transporter (DMT)-like permease